jgi:hypothetical protein
MYGPGVAVLDWPMDARSGSGASTSSSGGSGGGGGSML